MQVRYHSAHAVIKAKRSLISSNAARFVAHPCHEGAEGAAKPNDDCDAQFGQVPHRLALVSDEGIYRRHGMAGQQKSKKMLRPEASKRELKDMQARTSERSTYRALIVEHDMPCGKETIR